MAVIEVQLDDFCKLVGKDMTMEFVEKKLPMLGLAWEGKEGNTFWVEVFPNRPDMLSVEGLARAFSSFIGVKKGLRDYKTLPSDFVVFVDEKVKDVRPYIALAVVENVKLSDEFIRSLMQLQEKLHATHGRKRKKVAIGLHDLSKVKFPVFYTTKPKEFKFIPLNENKEMSLEEILEKHPKGKEYGWIIKSFEEYPILIDAKQMVLSMPPIINSTHTMVTESTNSLLIDVTGTDEKAVEKALNILVTSFADRRATIKMVKVKYADKEISYPKLEPEEMELEVSYVNKLLGLELTSQEVSDLLAKMGYGVAPMGEVVKVFVPCYRTDVMHPIDLVEDVAIAFGYENFEPSIPNIATVGQEDELERFSRKLRDFLVGYGLQEVKTFVLTNEQKLFEKMERERKPVVEAENPKTEEYKILRDLLLPSLLEVLARNKHRSFPQNLFEVADVVDLDETTDTKTRNVRKLCVVTCHSKASFSEIKSIAESLLENLGVKFELKEGQEPYMVTGRCAKIIVDGKEIGTFGEVHPKVLENWGIEMPVASLEISIEMFIRKFEQK